ncbi:MAG: GC-type dockerin domain-anchored protein [Planctomycetota bacterium]
MQQLKKAALVIAAAGCTAGVAFIASQQDRSEHARTAVAQGMDLTRVNTQTPVMACFSPDTPLPERYSAAIESMFLESMLRHNFVASWTGTGQGTTLSWSFVPDGLTIPSGIGEPTAPSNLFSTLDGQFGGNRAIWISRFDQSFQRWADLSGLNYIRVTDGGNDWDDGAFWGASGNDVTRGDVRISMKPIDGGSNTLAYNSFPTNSDMVIDSAEGWNGGSSDRFLRNTIMHEHGHGLGAAHICSTTTGYLMEPFLQTSFDGPQHDDIRGVHRGYGDPNEPDNNTASATDLGTIGSGATVSLGGLPAQPVSAPQPNFGANLSIDANSEQDFFEFSVATPALIDVTIDPVGFTYDDSDQAGNGSCFSGNPNDSEEIANLAFQILDSGATVIATFDSAGLGQNEVATDLLLPSAGTYFLRVFETNSPPDSQLYQGSITVTGAAECTVNGDCDDGDPCTTDTCNNGECTNDAANDCNNNGRDDVCEIAQGDAEDCNMNGIPDDCEIDPDPFAESSGQLNPIGSGSPQSYTFVGASEAGSDVTLDFETIGDFNSGAEFLEVFVEGVSYGNIFVSGGAPVDCFLSTNQIILTAGEWNTARTSGGGNVTVDFIASADVDSGACLPGQDNYIQVDVSYDTNASASDTNMNGIPDECETGGGCAFADITTTSTCDTSTPDGVIDLSDFSCYLSLWSTSDAFADITLTGVCDVVAGGGDGVDLSDFSCYLNEWSAGCPMP